MIKIAITGAGGKISSKIIKSTIHQDDMKVVAAIAAPKSRFEGNDVGELLGKEKMHVPVTGAHELEKVLREKMPDVLVDFTIADAAVDTIITAAKCGVNVVVGTTGLSDEQMAVIKNSVEENEIKAVISPNMAVGVNVFFKVLKDLSNILGDYDVEIIETHHRQKKDAPSGTAVKAAEIIANELNRDMGEVGIYGRKGIVGERTHEEICIHSVRGGDVVGDHTVLFAGDGERLEIVHRANNRQIYVEGVIKAIRYVVEAPAGKICDMEDVLDLK